MTDGSPPWVGRLQAALERVDNRNRADIGVYVQDLRSGTRSARR